MKISEYVKGPWTLFSSQNNLRSLPSMKDGQITTTRKLLWGLKDQKEFDTVERLGLSAASKTAYKNGGTSISNALTNMAKRFPGTNNVPFFDAEGQFGTQIDNEASATRYINTKISKSFRQWFHPDDDHIIPMRQERGMTLEPWWFAPIAPTILINGGFGIGTGYACNIHQHDPKQVVNLILNALDTGEVTERLLPWWNGWGGSVTIDPTNPKRFFVRGVFKKVGTTELKITELPPSFNNENYKRSVIIPLLDSDDILSIQNDSNDIDGWNISVKFKRGVLSSMTDEQIVEMFQLRTTVSHVINVWGVDDKITSYDNIERLLEDWIVWRLGVYGQRRSSVIARHEESIRWETLRAEVMTEILSSKGNVNETTIMSMVVSAGYGKEQFNKLMDTPIRRITLDGIKKAEEFLVLTRQKLQTMKATTPEHMMREDLELLKKTL